MGLNMGTRITQCNEQGSNNPKVPIWIIDAGSNPTTIHRVLRSTCILDTTKNLSGGV